MFNRNQNSSTSGSVVGPRQPVGPAPQPMPGQPQDQSQQPVQSGQGISSGGAINPAAVSTTPTKKRNTQLIETIILIVVSLIAATFIGLFVFMYVQWNNASTNLQGQIDAAVAQAVEVNTTKLQDEFTEKEKYPYETFTGPEEYGSLSFEYPKTWSVYVAKDKSDGGDFEAYFNPEKVSPVSATTINALRVQIVARSTDTVTTSYDGNVKKGTLSQSAYQFAKTGESANFYEGELPSGKFQGIAVVFKLRDKTAILQTDAKIFRDDFMKLLSSVSYSQ